MTKYVYYFGAAEADGNGKMKPVIYLDGHDRGVVANATRYNTVSELAKSRNTDDWLGMRVAIRRGKTQFAGKTVDCVEFGAPKKSAATQKAELAADLNDAVPF